MAGSLAILTRLGDDSLHGVAAVIDRGLRLNNGAVRNAARAVTQDRVNARARAEATAALSGLVASPREFSLRGA
jgi:hypothetical protein